MTRSGGNTHHYVAHLVGVNLYIVTFGPVNKKCLHLVEMVRGTGNLRDFVEDFPN